MNFSRLSIYFSIVIICSFSGCAHKQLNLELTWIDEVDAVTKFGVYQSDAERKRALKLAAKTNRVILKGNRRVQKYRFSFPTLWLASLNFRWVGNNAFHVYNRASAQLATAECYYRRARYKEALDYYMKAIDSYGNYIAFDEVIEKEYKLCYEMLERNKGDFFNVVNNKDAMKGYDHISKRARHTKYAPLSLYRSAVISLYNKKYADSVDKFEGFLQKYPKHEYVPQAYLGLMRTLVRSALETHGDSASFRKALFVRSKMRKLFPDTEILKQAEAYVAMARKAQAAHLLYLASFYQRKVHYRPHASKIYIETILSDYSDTESAQKAQDLLAKLPKKLDPLPEPGSLTPKSN